MILGHYDSAFVDWIDPINRLHPLNRGLVARWQVVPGVSGGSKFLDLCRKHHGTLTNGPTWVGALGRPGGWGAVFLDGTDDHVVVDAASGLPNLENNWTISVLCQPTTGTARVYFALNISSGLQRAVFQTGGVGNINIDAHAVTGINSVTLSGGAITGGIEHLTFTKSGTAFAYYRNGRSVSTGTQTLFSAQMNRATIGANRPNTGAASFAQGLADRAEVWSRALSATEVAELYQLSRRRDDPTLNWLRPVMVFDVAGGGGATGQFKYLPLLGVG